MRRADIETIEISNWGDRLAKRILQGEIDANYVIRILEPYATERRKTRLREVFDARIGSVTLVLDGLHDPHNGAALVRTSEALGVAHLHIIERSENFLAHAGVARGTHKWVKVTNHPSSKECVEALRADGMTIIGAHPKGDLEARDLATIPRVAIVLGNEHAGISPELTTACEHQVRIPMRGFAESLNVSVSGAILLSYATADRGGDLSEEEKKRLYARGLAVTVPNASHLLEAGDG